MRWIYNLRVRCLTCNLLSHGLSNQFFKRLCEKFFELYENKIVSICGGVDVSHVLRMK